VNLFLAFFLGDLLLSGSVSRTPLAFARLVLIPVGKQLTLPVPPRVAALVFQLREATATYRKAPETEFVLAALPGEARAVRDDQDLRFVPSVNWVLAQPRGWSKNLVRVEISGTANTLVLKARRLPSELTWAVLAVILLARAHGLRGHFLTAVFLAIVCIVSITASQRRARSAFTAVEDELRARLAIANGDPPPKAEPSVPKLAGDEWACACGTVNKMTRTMCHRCWAQRPGAP
jgi:hypothetical protein